MSYSPHFFGPALWKTIHVMAATATTAEKRKYFVWFVNEFLPKMLPCDKCKLHYIENLKQMPVEPYSNTNVSLFFWTWKLHDGVNKQTHKAKHLQLTYEQAYEIYFPGPKVIRQNRVQYALGEEEPRMRAKASNQTECMEDCGEPIHEYKETNFNDFKTKRKKVFVFKNE